MKARYAMLAAFAAAVTLTSAAAGGPGVAKQRIGITSNLYPKREFVLVPQQAGTLRRDSGVARVIYGTWKRVTREGQEMEVLRAYVTFEGRRGTFTIRERTEWIDAGRPSIAIGTWKIVRGTGQYAQSFGSGRSAHSGLAVGSPWYARLEGVLSAP
jgi:hypothetical protein